MHSDVTRLTGFDFERRSGKLNSKFRTGGGFFLGRSTDNTYGPDKEEEESFFHARSVLLKANAKKKDSVRPWITMKRMVAILWQAVQGWGEPTAFGVNGHQAISIALRKWWIFSITSFPFVRDTGIEMSVSRI